MLVKFKLFFKKSAFGRYLYPLIGRVYRLYKVPARRRKLKETGYENLKYIIEVAEKEGIQVIPIFGTLLGLVRDKGFIPGDEDIDLAVLPGPSPKEMALTFIEKYGFHFNQALSYHGTVTEFSLIYNGLSTDFFFLEETETDMRTATYSWNECESYTDPRQNNVSLVVLPKIKEQINTIVHGIEVKIPSNSEDVLFALYGSGWKVPDPNFTEDSRPGRIAKDDFGYTVTLNELTADRIVR